MSDKRLVAYKRLAIVLICLPLTLGITGIGEAVIVGGCAIFQKVSSCEVTAISSQLWENVKSIPDFQKRIKPGDEIDIHLQQNSVVRLTVNEVEVDRINGVSSCYSGNSVDPREETYLRSEINKIIVMRKEE